MMGLVVTKGALMVGMALSFISAVPAALAVTIVLI